MLHAAQVEPEGTGLGSQSTPMLPKRTGDTRTVSSPMLHAAHVKPERDARGGDGRPEAHEDSLLGLLEDEVAEHQLAGGPAVMGGFEYRVLELPIYDTPANGWGCTAGVGN